MQSIHLRLSLAAQRERERERKAAPSLLEVISPFCCNYTHYFIYTKQSLQQCSSFINYSLFGNGFLLRIGPLKIAASYLQYK